jgi:outer membrane protein assembly factor BamE (lipoprotein component of BamABCDE complex)
MNCSNSFIRSTFKLSTVGIFALTSTLSCFASDSDRITQLEKEVQDLKHRLTQIESPPASSTTRQKPVVGTYGDWKILANWRSLKKGMSYEEVRALLGEPTRIQGGDMTYWFYPSQSGVTFYKDKLDFWTEPR